MNGRSVELVKPDGPEYVVLFKPPLVLHRFVETEWSLGAVRAFILDYRGGIWYATGGLLTSSMMLTRACHMRYTAPFLANR